MVKNAECKIEEILVGNLNVVEKALDVYADYIFILSDKAWLTAYLEDPKPKDTEEYSKKINFYVETINDIRNKLPFEIWMNMILIDCQSLNQSLITECYALIKMIIEKINTTTQDMTGAVIATAEQIKSKLQEKPLDAEQLVAAETYLDDVRSEWKNQLI